MNMIRKYGKALAAVAGAALTVAYGALSGDQRIEPDEAVQIAIAAATAIGVYLVPLTPQYRWGKTAVAVVLSVLQVLATVILGGLDSNEWIALLLAALTVLGVGAAPAVSSNGTSNATPRQPTPTTSQPA
ncbi:hypothetical protein [Plantactinospora sp. ZYX-F-223]|uniref:hypothetical protein n=1 Tax=Plantactinospora sp. ZYX-F-223 TaxID=3144103 RepID=UPI0031FBA9EE